MHEELLTLGEVIDNISYGKIATSILPEAPDRGAKIFCGKNGDIFWLPNGSDEILTYIHFRKVDDLEPRRWTLEYSAFTKALTDTFEEILLSHKQTNVSQLKSLK